MDNTALEMGTKRAYNLIIFVLFWIRFTSADDTSAFVNRLEATEELVRALSNRVDILESREKIHLDRIGELEARVSGQRETIEELQRHLHILAHVDKMALNTSNNKNRDESYTNSEYISGGIVNTAPVKRDSTVQRIRQTAVQSPVAFLALITRSFENAGVKQIVVFDNVITNLGNNYNPSLGTFTAPLEGVYVFSSTLVTSRQANDHASFYRNGDRINVMYVHGAENGWDTSSSTITLHLLQGDIVTVRNGDNNGAYWGDNHSSFSGFLLSSFVSTPSVHGN